MKMIKAVLFDFDGVLCQTEQYILENRLKHFKSLGLYVTKEMLIPLTGGTKFTREQLYDEIFGDQEIYFKNKERIADYRFQPPNFKELKTENVDALLKELHNRGIKLVVASNSTIERLERVLNECEIIHYFDKLVVPTMDKLKPHPYVYLKCLEALQFSKDECLVVEDSTIGISAAKNAGLYVLALKDKDGLIDQSAADRIIIDIMQVLDYL